MRFNRVRTESAGRDAYGLVFGDEVRVVTDARAIGDAAVAVGATVGMSSNEAGNLDDVSITIFGTQGECSISAGGESWRTSTYSAFGKVRKFDGGS